MNDILVRAPRLQRASIAQCFRRGMITLAATLIYNTPGTAQTVDLGTAGGFAVLGASAVSNTGPTIINGDLGISPGTASSVTGFPPGIVNGTTHFADAQALSAQNDTTTAYITLAGRACSTTIAGDLGGSTLLPGVYCSATTIGLTGTVTLDAQNDSNAVLIFQAGNSLTTASASNHQQKKPARLTPDGSKVVALGIQGDLARNDFWPMT